MNNQTDNLRPATTAQNQANRKPRRDNFTGFKGVSWRADKARWQAQIKDGKAKHLGYFDTAFEAALAYDDAAKQAFGEFAYSNERQAASVLA